MSETKRDQCCKCRWVGTDDEKGRRKEYDEYGTVTDVCPVCSHPEFYEATERQHQNYLKRINK